VTLLLLAALVVVQPTRSAEDAGASINQGTSFDPSTLDETPLQSHGVTNPSGGPQYPAIAAVFDFAEIGDRIFVGGHFPTVQESWNGPSHNQSYVAAFDRDSGDWISTWTPTLDGAVYALDVSNNGTLLVGGEFTTVNGATREGMVALDPITGSVDNTYAASVENWWGGGAPAVVRNFEKVGTDVYVVGNFDHVRVGANTYRVWSSARIRAGSGQLDPTFLPKVRFGAWDVAVDQARGRVHLVGDFDEIDGNTDHKRHGVVDLNGTPLTNGIAYHEDNSNNQNIQTGVAMATANRVWVGGAEHITQVKNAGNMNRLGFLTWGMGCDTFQPANCGNGTYPGGGDVQVIDEVDGWMLVGCHCWNRTAGLDDAEHYSSFTGQRTGNRLLGIYNAANAQIQPFIPELRERYYGTWGVHVDANGCLYAGGDYTADSNGVWVGGFGKFCANTEAPSVSGSSANGAVELTWTQPMPSGHLPIEEYKVFRDGNYIGAEPGDELTFTDPSPAGPDHDYQVEAVDTHGRKAMSTTENVTVVAPPADTQDPSGPLGPDATTDNTSVTLTWEASVDNVGVSGYLVHDNYQYLAYVPGPNSLTYTHSGLTADDLHRYQIRAKDAADNVSIPSIRLDVIVGDGVSVPDNMPLDVTLTQNGTSVDVDWEPPTNPGGINGYLVHHNYQYEAYVPGVANHAYTDTGLTVGTTHRYEIRSQGNGVTSLPTERVTITLQ